MSPTSLHPVSSPGLAHYERLLALTGTQYRFSDGARGVGVVLGMLDARTGRLPIGLVNGKRQYYADILHYDANLRSLRVTDPAVWTAFVETYVGGGWLIGVVQVLGGLAFTVVGVGATLAAQTFAFLLIPMLLFGLVGLFFYGLIGVALANLALQALPILIGSIAVYAALCGLLSWEHSARRRRIGLTIENLISRQLMPLFD